MATGTLLSVALIIFLVIVLPTIIVLHFVTKWRQGRELSREDERLLEELWEFSQRIEQRLDTLERIIDDDLPTTRSRHAGAHIEH